MPEQTNSREILAKLYADAGVPVDQLPYTSAFETLYADFLIRTGKRLSQNEVWRLLLSIRKAGNLPRLK